MPDRLFVREALFVLRRPKLAPHVDEGSAREFVERILRYATVVDDPGRYLGFLGLYDAVFAILSWASFEYVVTE